MWLMVPRASKAQGEALQEWHLHFVEVHNKETNKVHNKETNKVHIKENSKVHNKENSKVHNKVQKKERNAKRGAMLT